MRRTPIGTSALVAILVYQRKRIRQVKLRLKDSAIRTGIGAALARTASAVPAATSPDPAREVSVNGRHRQVSDVADRMHKRLPAYVRAITDAYEAHCFWWEAIDYIRKLVLVGGILNISAGSSTYLPGSIEQLSLGVLLSVLFIAWYHHLQPYESDWDDRLQFLCQLSVFATLMFAIIIEVDPSKASHPMMLALLFSLALAPVALALLMVLIESLGGKLDGCWECVAYSGEWLARKLIPALEEINLGTGISGRSMRFGSFRAKTAASAPGGGDGRGPVDDSDSEEEESERGSTAQAWDAGGGMGAKASEGAAYGGRETRRSSEETAVDDDRLASMKAASGGESQWPPSAEGRSPPRASAVHRASEVHHHPRQGTDLHLRTTGL